MIATARLELIPGTVELLQAALDGGPELAAALGVAEPGSWPPEYLDPPALRHMRDRLAEGPTQAGWWLNFIVLVAGPRGRTLIGCSGFKGPPTDDGTVEVGYTIVPEHHRRGYATEAVRALVSHAFAIPAVRRVTAETLPELTASIGVLEKCGFHFCGDGSEPGVIRFELLRPEPVGGERRPR